MARITGIGGVFFKSRNDRATLATWYQKHLGMPLESFGGAVLRWPDDEAEDKGLTVWHIAEKESQWFSPSDSPFMINYRVDNLDEMIAQLSAGGVEIVGGPGTSTHSRVGVRDVTRYLTFEYLPRTDANLALTNIRAQHPNATGP